MTNAPLLTCVIPVRDDALRLARCLSAIFANRYPSERLEVVVVDNGSIDGSAEVARQAGARVLVLPGLRVGDLRNRGASLSRGDIVAFVDADHEVSPDWVASAVDALRGTRVGAAGAPYHAPPGGTWVQRTYNGFRLHVDGSHDVEWLGSGNLVVRRDALEQVRGFDATLDSCEDVDLCQRLRRAGYRVVSDSRLTSTHLGDPPTLRWLFMSELWRARNNLRASLRGPFSWRALPSAVIPLVQLLCLMGGVTALLLGGSRGWSLAAGAAAVVVALSALRAARLMANLRTANAARAAQALAVALTYDLARALAVVLRGRHYRRTSPAHAARVVPERQ